MRLYKIQMYTGRTWVDITGAREYDSIKRDYDWLSHSYPDDLFKMIVFGVG